MRLIGDFLRDECAQSIPEYALTLFVFGIVAALAIVAFQVQADNTLVNTRARMSCNGVRMTATSSATVDGSGTVSCN